MQLIIFIIVSIQLFISPIHSYLLTLKSAAVQFQSKPKAIYVLTKNSDDEYRLPRIEFEYCTGCRWLLRSAWMAQEILTTFEKEIGEVALIPCKNESGTFIVRIDGAVVWNRKENNGFPEIKDLKQRIRDLISPEKTLGHSDRKS